MCNVGNMKLILLNILMFVATGFDTDAQVVLYTRCNYKGETSVLRPGNYSYPSQFRLSNKSIASLMVPAGFVVELYTDTALIGQPFLVSASVSCFPPQWENLVKSIKVIYQPGKPVAYYRRSAAN
jgi:hypothetical protein